MGKLYPTKPRKILDMGVAVGEEGDCIALYIDM
jgi:hypothetical protein